MIKAAAILVVLALAAPALAQAPSEADLVKKGVAEREQGHDEAALELFRQAFAQYRTPRAQAQMGLACQALGRWRDADLNLRAALAASTDSWITNNRRVLEQAQTVVGQHVGTLDVVGNVAGAEILVDGNMIATLPLSTPLRVGAGTAVVQVRAEGYAPVQKPVTVVAGQLTRESFMLVTLTKAIAVPAPPPAFVEAPAALPPVPPTLLQRRVTFITAAAATAIVGGITIWSGLDTLSARDRYRDMPTQAGYDDGVKREHRTNILIAGTSVLGAATLGLGLFATRW